MNIMLKAKQINHYQTILLDNLILQYKHHKGHVKY